MKSPAGGLPKIEGTTVLEKRRYFLEHYDFLRTSLMFEPRGHADMYVAAGQAGIRIVKSGT